MSKVVNGEEWRGSCSVLGFVCVTALIILGYYSVMCGNLFTGAADPECILLSGFYMILVVGGWTAIGCFAYSLIKRYHQIQREIQRRNAFILIHAPIDGDIIT